MANNDKVTQNFLDSSQYQTDSILEYERVYGEDFVSPGGKDLAHELIARLGLEAGARVLDVGCGLGGSAFVMAREFGLRVDGIDLSKNMLAIANEKLALNGLSDAVNLFWGDCLDLTDNATYDAVYSRDVFLHIHDKARLFTVLNRSLRAGGQLLFSDYCCCAKPWSDEFGDYVDDRGYDLHTVDEYSALISAAGFEQVVGKDITSRFVEILKSDIERIMKLELDSDHLIKLEQSWRQKLARAQAGEQRWGLFTARANT